MTLTVKPRTLRDLPAIDVRCTIAPWLIVAHVPERSSR